MKKSLLALAVFGAFAGTASAQSTSSVTLYGLLDIGVGYQKGTEQASAVNKETLWKLDSGVQSGSRWGLRGSEDLGGGLRAVFNLEGGIGVDNGTLAQGGRLFGRWAYAGLAGNWGEVRLGRQWAAGFEYFGNIDVFGTGFLDAGAQTTFSSVDAYRIDNMIAYRSPVMSGFSAMIGYSFNPGFGTPIPSEVPDLSDNPALITGALQYSAGPFLGVVTYESFNNPTEGTSDQRHIQVGATWNFGFLKLHGAFAKEKDQFLAPTITPSSDSSSWLAGVTVPLAGGNLLAQYQSRDDDDATNADVTSYQVGFTYPLSRRTNLYTFFSDTQADETAIGIPLTTPAAVALNSTYQNISRRQFNFGVRHLF